MSERSRRSEGRDWIRHQTYLNIHNRRLDELRTYFVVGDDLSYLFGGETRFFVRGRVRCDHGLFIDARTSLEVDERRNVRVLEYRYHAGVEGPSNRPIFRYDNAHPYAREGHPDDHHRHRYDHATWQEIKPPTWVGHDRRPLLSQALEELREWWETAGQHLDLTERSEGRFANRP